MQKFLLMSMQETDTAPILVYEVADKSEIEKSVADLEEQFDTYDQENWIKTNPGLVEHIGFRIASGAKILLEMDPTTKLALSVIDSEMGPKISMLEISISEKERPVALSLSMDEYIVDRTEECRRFCMNVGIHSLKEVWNLYLSERKIAAAEPHEIR